MNLIFVAVETTDIIYIWSPVVGVVVIKIVH